ncbi:MAG: hypothetical protein E7031_02105 [Akkermansiaceae bacterium]|nr:hypothetical protein [Akkermansiaceae bacterium]
MNELDKLSRVVKNKVMTELFPVDMMPEEVQALGRYLRKHAPYMYNLRVVCAPDKVRKSKRVEVGLKTDIYKVALIRAAEFISLLHFCGWQIYSEDINAPALASLFPLSDLSDDLGSDREEEEQSPFYGGNAGMPFLINWRKDRARIE